MAGFELCSHAPTALQSNTYLYTETYSRDNADANTKTDTKANTQANTQTDAYTHAYADDRGAVHIDDGG